MVKQEYRRSSWSQRHYWRGVPTTRWSRRKASPENLLDHVMFPACHRIARLFDRVEDLGYRTVDQLVYERLRCPTATACSPERSSLLETRSGSRKRMRSGSSRKADLPRTQGRFGLPLAMCEPVHVSVTFCCAAERRSEKSRSATHAGMREALAREVALPLLLENRLRLLLTYAVRD
jgi:hypothetical protein